MTDPSSHVPAGGGVYNLVAGVQAVYGRNALSQPNSLTVGGQSVVTSAYYNAAGQLQQLNWAGQMWKQQIKAGSTVIGGWEYYLHPTQNNGRITGTKDLQSPEEIEYTYDSLNRLVNASKTGGGWSEIYEYDGFGNLTTKGASSWLVDTATNRLHSSTGATYDANGNLTGLSGGVSFTHDTANRVTTANPTGEKYGYTTDNRRVYKYRPGWGEEITFWGPAGRLATYRIDTISNGTMYFVEQTRNVWFGSRLLRTGPAATPTKLATDRLGSIRLRQTGANPIEYLTYAPYGEQRSGPNGEGEKFATYYRDQTNLDYADQRYFSNSWGRFSTPDPYKASAASEVPQSWNRYSYVVADPVNKHDPSGLIDAWGCMDCLMAPPDALNANTGGGIVWSGVSAAAVHDAWVARSEAGYVSNVQSVFLANTLNGYQQAGTLTQQGEDFLANVVFPSGQVIRVGIFEGCQQCESPEGDSTDVPLNSNAQIVLSQVGQSAAPLTEPEFWATWTAAAGVTAIGGLTASRALEFVRPYLGGGLEVVVAGVRVNLLGDWRQIPGHAMEWYQRLPHYHRHFPGPGGSINRHRPWESPGAYKGKPLPWWKRF